MKKIKRYTSDHLDTHAPSFTNLTKNQIHYLNNLDKMREAATKYATGKLVTTDPKHIAAVQEYLKMELLDLSIRNERVALLDEITRAHAMLNNITTDKYPLARFAYPDTSNSYTPHINLLKNESI